MLDRYIVEIGGYVLDVDVHPCEDLDGEFTAFCRDEKEFLKVNGWLVDDMYKVQDAGPVELGVPSNSPVYNCIRGELA